jgi:hypothetical protein|tara:strand:- start:711 stop:1199 length:489 start_codon:yes stop_codon:yes gene_type:complete
MGGWRDLEAKRAKAKEEAAARVKEGRRKALTGRDFYRRGMFGAVVGCGTGYMGCFVSEVTQSSIRDLNLTLMKTANSSALRSMVAVGCFFSAYQLTKASVEVFREERSMYHAGFAAVACGLPTVMAFRRIPRGPALLSQLGISLIGLVVIDQISESKGDRDP